MNKIIREDCERIYAERGINWQSLNNSTVLITGAYGMLASYMVWFLIFLNEYVDDFKVRILAICRNEQKAVEKFGNYCNAEYFQLIFQDVSSELVIDENVDYIIHAASFASSQYYSTNPVDVILPNVLGTLKTLQFAKEKKVRGYLFFSSAEIYGIAAKEIIDEDDSGYINCMDVRSCYGESKRLGENLCKAYWVQYSVPTVVVRPAHTYGPTMDLKNDQRVFSEFVSNIINGEDICIKSDGLATRTFCYIADATLAYFKVLLEGERGEAYNVLNMDAQIRIRDLADMLVALFPEKNLHASYQKRDDDYLENSNKVQSKFSTRKLERLGWSAKYSIEEGFKRTILSFEDGKN